MGTKRQSFNIGAAGQRVADNIEHLISVGSVQKAIQRAEEALDAIEIVRDPAQVRSRGDPVSYVEVPAWGPRLAAIHFLAEAKFGKPKQRVEMNHSDDDTTREEARRQGLRQLLERPAELRRMLDALALASGDYIDVEAEKTKELEGGIQ